MTLIACKKGVVSNANALLSQQRGEIVIIGKNQWFLLCLVCLCPFLMAADRYQPSVDSEKPAVFHVKNHTAMGLQPGNLVLIGREPIGEVVSLDLADDGEILVTFKVWRTFRNSLMDNMMVHIRKNKRSSKVVFVTKTGGRSGERVPPGTMFHAAKKHHVWGRRYLANPTRHVAGRISGGKSTPAAQSSADQDPQP